MPTRCTILLTAFFHGLRCLLYVQLQKKTWRLLARKWIKMSTELQRRITYNFSYKGHNPVFIAIKFFIIPNGIVAQKNFIQWKYFKLDAKVSKELQMFIHVFPLTKSKFESVLKKEEITKGALNPSQSLFTVHIFNKSLSLGM